MALNGVDPPRKEARGLIGERIGKTTVFNVVTGIYRPDRGSVAIRERSSGFFTDPSSGSQDLQNIGCSESYRHGRCGPPLSPHSVRPRLRLVPRGKYREEKEFEEDHLCPLFIAGQEKQLAEIFPMGIRKTGDRRAVASEPSPSPGRACGGHESFGGEGVDGFLWKSGGSTSHDSSHRHQMRLAMGLRAAGRPGFREVIAVGPQ